MLTGCVYGHATELSTSFSILFSQSLTSLRQVSFLCAGRAALQNWKNFSHVEMIVENL